MELRNLLSELLLEVDATFIATEQLDNRYSDHKQMAKKNVEFSRQYQRLQKEFLRWHAGNAHNI